MALSLEVTLTAKKGKQYWIFQGEGNFQDLTAEVQERVKLLVDLATLSGENSDDIAWRFHLWSGGTRFEFREAIDYCWVHFNNWQKWPWDETGDENAKRSLCMCGEPECRASYPDV